MRTLIQTEKAQLKLKKNLYLTTDNYSAHQVKQPYTQRGFTLIELMIVVAIIGILASIAIPAYSDYIKRARVSEMLAKAAEVKTTLSEYYASRNLFPTVAQYSIQVAAPSSNIANINNQTTNGTVGVGAVGTFDVVSNAANIGALTLTFTGTATANGIGWVCTAAGADVRLAPGNCK